jgi:hypothetical protein
LTDNYDLYQELLKENRSVIVGIKDSTTQSAQNLQDLEALAKDAVARVKSSGKFNVCYVYIRSDLMEALSCNTCEAGVFTIDELKKFIEKQMTTVTPETDKLPSTDQSKSKIVAVAPDLVKASITNEIDHLYSEFNVGYIGSIINAIDIIQELEKRLVNERLLEILKNDVNAVLEEYKDQVSLWISENYQDLQKKINAQRSQDITNRELLDVMLSYLRVKIHRLPDYMHYKDFNYIKNDKHMLSFFIIICEFIEERRVKTSSPILELPPPEEKDDFNIFIRKYIGEYKHQKTKFGGLEGLKGFG